MRRLFTSRLFFLTTLVLLLLLPAACDEKPTETNEPVRTDTYKVAIYSGRGASSACVTASTKMFEWIGYKVTLVNANYVIQSDLNDFSVVCMPGGDMYDYSQDLGAIGIKKIRSFVSNGGGYVGICGGAYFAGENIIWQGRQLNMTPLAFFPATATGPINAIFPYPQNGMCEVNFINPEHPITQSLPDSSWILYSYGPAFTVRLTTNTVVLAKYAIGGKACVLARDYGQGRVFIIGTHPEFEEDSDRDGTTFGDEHDDVGSDWELMKNAVRWCTRN
jgi:biotin--protein ligase